MLSPVDAQIIDALAGPGYLVLDGFLGEAARAQLARSRDARRHAGLFRPAAVGAGSARAVRPGIRGDEISWIDEPCDPAEGQFLARLDAVRLACNRELMLGLEAVELHFARYEPGQGYERHLDRSPAGIERVVTVVYYLNETWPADAGGDLVLETGAGSEHIAPLPDRLVVFLAERFAHAVWPSRQVRSSITGWFHRRSLARGG